MKQQQFIIPALAGLLAVAELQAAPPSAPFTPDANTVLLMHFDSNLNDSSANAYNGAFSTIGGYTDPAYVAGQTGYGQCMSGNGASTLNGVLIAGGVSNLTTSPLTVEAWIYIPTPSVDQNFNILDLAAGRLNFFVGVANGNPSIYPHFAIYNGVTGQDDVTNFGPADGWSFDAWHHIAATYGSTQVPAVKFYLNGTQKVAGVTSVNSEWQKIGAYPGLTAGRVWVPTGPPTSNLMPLDGRIDELRLSNVVRYGTGDTLLHLKFDGDLADSSPYGWPTAMTTFGTTTPEFIAAPAPYGQALFGDGTGTMNGLQITNGALSQISSPFTVDWRSMFPTAYAGQEYSQCVLDLGAGRFLVRVRHAGSGDPNGYVEVNIYDTGLNPQSNYFAITPAAGWADGVWHDFRLTYDPSAPAGQIVKLFFNGVPMPMYGSVNITNEFNKSPDRPATSSRLRAPLTT